jgi:hypothetical protein
VGGYVPRMITSTRRVLFAVAVGALLSCGSVAVADETAATTTYSCDALTSAKVPAVKKRLTAQGVDVSNVDGPVGLSCRRSTELGPGDTEEVVASVTGVDGAAYRCADAQEKSGPSVVFFVDCGQSTSDTE